MDFLNLSSITLYSDRLSPKELNKLEDSIRRGNFKATYRDFLIKGQGMKSVKKMLSQNHHLNSEILPGLTKNFEDSKTLRNL